jgi:hypothetical protein
MCRQAVQRLLVMANTIAPTALHWAWDGWLPLGMLTPFPDTAW